MTFPDLIGLFGTAPFYFFFQSAYLSHIFGAVPDGPYPSLLSKYPVFISHFTAPTHNYRTFDLQTFATSFGLHKQQSRSHVTSTSTTTYHYFYLTHLCRP